MPYFGKKPDFSKPVDTKASPSFGEATKPNFTGGTSTPSFASPAASWTAKPAPKPLAKPPVEIDKGVQLEPPKAKPVEAPTPSRRLVMHPPPAKDFRPNVDMLVATVRNYLRAMSPTAMPDLKSDEWEKAAEHNKLQLEQELIQIGLKDAIDFER